MSNPRDTGRYDATTDTWHSENIRVDFAWGNIPMQPNDDRDVPLDPDLDSHIIATSGYQNFPSFTRGGIFDDTDTNVAVPNLVGLENPTAAQAALADVGLVLGDTNSSTAGANSSNDGTVKSQSPVAGTLVNEGSPVDIVVYDNPGVTVPNLVGQTQAGITLLLGGALVPGTVTTSTVGGTPSNWGTIKSQSPAAGSIVPIGTAVDYVFYDYVSTATTGAISGFARQAIAALGGSLNGDQAIMYVTGRTTWPSVGSTITVTGTSASQYNVTFTVTQVAADDAYNTGGTAIKVTLVSGSFAGVNSSSGGTWTKQGFGSADATFTSVPVGYDPSYAGGSWAFVKSGHTVAVGDWIRASGFFVIDENGNRTESGSINVNGDWQIDAANSNSFSSSALRAEIGSLFFANASSIGTGTVAVDNQ